jgi:hypothetical protein
LYPDAKTNCPTKLKKDLAGHAELSGAEQLAAIVDQQRRLSGYEGLGLE